MNVDGISFENLPKAVAHLVSEVEELKTSCRKRSNTCSPSKTCPDWY